MNSETDNLKLVIIIFILLKFFKFNRKKIILDTKQFYANIIQVAKVVVMEKDVNLPMGKKN